MARPSRNVDQRLLRAGRELFPEAGCAGLSVRKVVERAEVNLGMFHYHFKSKDAFVRAVLESLYEAMFADLAKAAVLRDDGDALPALRRAVLVIARFVATHRVLLRRLVADAVAGEPLAIEFVRANFPRHLQLVATLVEAGKAQGVLQPMATMQAVAFIASAVGVPLLAGAVIADPAFAPPALARRFAREVMSEAAIAERLDAALRGIEASPEPR